MANTIQIKRRNGMTNASFLADGEFGFDVSNNTVYIGNNNQNIPIGRDLTHLDLKGYDLILGTTSSDSDDSSDIEWLYGNGQEKARLWMSNDLTAKIAPYFREYESDGTALYTGNLVLGDGTGASGTWGISITGNAITATGATALNSYATIGSSSTTHATALQTYFNANKTTIPRNKLIHFYDQSGGNGSATFGYFLDQYDNNPYGGFFVAHYNNAYYVGISNGTYTLQKIITDAGGTMTGSLVGNSTAALGSTANPFHNLVLGGATTSTMTAASTNPRITFQEGTGTQPVHLIYTDYDNYRSPAGLKVIGGTNATPAWFEVEGNIYAAAFKGNADTATKLGTSNVGTSSRPIYLSSGAPTAISGTIGGTMQPVYISSGTITACSAYKDFIVDQGITAITQGTTTEHWIWRKWNSGVAECWGKFYIVLATSAWSRMLPNSSNSDYTAIEAKVTDGINYPSGLFVSTTTPNLNEPEFECSLTTAGVNSYGVWCELYGYGTNTKTPAIYAVRPAWYASDFPTAACGVVANMRATGRWKK